jgi:hypothetical protein
MEKVKGSGFRFMKTICDCISVAARQAREAEIDVPAKRRFHLMNESGDASSADSVKGIYMLNISTLKISID